MVKRFRKILLPILSLLAAALLFLGIGSLLPAPEAADAVTVSVLPQELGDLFTDYTRTELSEKYASEEKLAQLRTQYAGNASALSVLSRAEEALHGSVRFDPSREFSTEDDAEHRISQYGNVYSYSNTTLKWNYAASDFIITGIYGKAGDTFTVYVDADEGVKLPQLVFTRHHYDYNNFKSYDMSLSRGANTVSYYFTTSDSAGPVYLVNPYTEDEQGGDVSVYIEGGAFYPVFEKDGDEEAFLGDLKEYEEARLKDSTIPDLAELSTDFAFVTTTSSSLYTTYITHRAIRPQENAELWGKFFTDLYEFNGLATSEDSPYGPYDPRIKGARINFRYMRQYQSSGAYATHGHIGFYREHYWFADFNHLKKPVPGQATDDYFVFAMGHEMGHVLDTDGRTLNETTNNMCATYVYLKLMGMTPHADWQPYGTSFEKLARDGTDTASAYRDIHILYKTSALYDRNYMVWWFLESCFPDYWAKLNHMYRTAKEGTGLRAEERMAYYSSLVTKVDLGSYFDRWGMFFTSGNAFSLKSASGEYNRLMEEARKKGDVSQKFDRFYYADDAEYDFIRTHEHSDSYDGNIASATFKKKGNSYVVSVSGKQDPYHLGYEIRVSADGGDTYTVAGFTRSAQFEDSGVYSGEPRYKARNFRQCGRTRRRRRAGSAVSKKSISIL